MKLATKEPLILLVSRKKKNAAPRSLCIALPVLQGRNYEKAGQHATSPPFVSASNEISVVSFHEAHIPSKFLVIPLFASAPSSIHRARGILGYQEDG